MALHRSIWSLITSALLSPRPAARFSVQALILSISCHAMKSSLRGSAPRFVTLYSVLLFFLLIPLNAADTASDMNLSPGDWKSILTNNQGHDACWLKNWLAGPECQKGANEEDRDTRRMFVPRGDLSPSACQCTVAYFNVLCGCMLSNGTSIANINYTQWKEDCGQNGFAANQSTSWIDDKGQDIPGWAFIVPNGLTFDSARILKVADRINRWSTIQIITPIITVISTLALVGLVYLFLHHRRRWKAQPPRGRSFFASIRKILIPSSQSVRHLGRNDNWQIDESHGRARFPSDNEADSESLVMRPNSHRLVESPVERSYWSPATDSPRHVRPPSQHQQSPESRVPYASTMWSIQNRVRNLMPWTTHPHPVTNVRPGSRYKIDGDQMSTKTRSNTISSLSTSRKHSGGKYHPINGRDKEYTEMIRHAGGTSNTVPDRGTRAEITDTEREAVAESVILIGDRDFTLESGSTGQHSSRQRLGKQNSVAFARGIGIEGILKTPESAQPNVQVEPPSPTLDLHSPKAIPTSPGAPPLLPPPPREQPPLPPIMERSTPRRTPSPHLRISTEFSSRNVSKGSVNGEDNAGVIIGAEDKNSRLRSSFAGDSQCQRGPSTSSVTNALSYTSINLEPHPLPRTSFDDNYHAGAYPTTVSDDGQDPSFSQRRLSGRGPRPLPQPRPELHASPPAQSHTHSSSLPGQISVSRIPGKVFPNDFNPYEAIPRSEIKLEPNRRSDADIMYLPQRHGHSSSVSLPRSPGEPEGQPQRGWSADDEMDRASLLVDQRPMQIDDGMNGVYIAAAQDVTTLGRLGEGSRHWANPSIESFNTVISSSGGGSSSSRLRNSQRFEAESPTLSMLERDIGSRSGFAIYAGRESLSGKSAWDASTQGHGKSSLLSPITHPLLQPNSNNQQYLSSIETPGQTHHRFSHSSQASRSTSPNPGHARSGSDMSINHTSRSQSRSREGILNLPKNDPLRLFPDSVRAAGYTIGLGPDAIPIPPRSPRLPEPGNSRASTSTSASASNNNRSEGSGAHDDDANDQRRGRPITSGVTGSGPLPGYVERGRAQQSRGATWGTDSSGVQTVFEAVQQLPEPINARPEGIIHPRIESWTPPGYSE